MRILLYQCVYLIMKFTFPTHPLDIFLQSSWTDYAIQVVIALIVIAIIALGMYEPLHFPFYSFCSLHFRLPQDLKIIS